MRWRKLPKPSNAGARVVASLDPPAKPFKLSVAFRELFLRLVELFLEDQRVLVEGVNIIAVAHVTSLAAREETPSAALPAD